MSNTVAIGDVWRSTSRCGWLKVIWIALPDVPDYDGGLPGCSIRFTNINGNWERTRWFLPARNQAEFVAKVENELMLTRHERARAA